MSKSIPQLTAKTDSEDADLFHMVRSNVDYKQTYSTIFDPLRDTEHVDAYNAGTTYDDATVNYAVYNNVLWRYINVTPSSGTTPGTDATKWTAQFGTILAHKRNEDISLAEGTSDWTTAADLRANLDTYKSVKVELTAAQVKDLFNTPVGLVTSSMVEPGEAIEIISASLFLDYGTAAFGNINIYIGHPSAPQRQMELGLGVMNATSDKFVRFAHTASGGATQIIADNPVAIGASATSATGDSAVTIYAYYRVITL